MASNFKDRVKLKASLNARLKADGYWDAYNKLRDHLKRNGVSENIAWKVAAYQFPPKDVSAPEIVSDAQYSEIAAGWQNGGYPLLDETSPAANKAKDVDLAAPTTGEAWRVEWERLAAEIGTRSAGEPEEIRWVVANYLTPVSSIKALDVPSAGALSILSWVKLSAANFGDFLRSNYTKIIPDKRELEYQNRFQDTGQDLQLLDDFMREFEREQAEKQQAEAASIGIQIHAH